jgi:hypothetical protein
LQQAAVADADFLGDVAVPPIGGEAAVAVVLLGGFDGDVIRAFSWMTCGASRVTPV